MSIVEEERKIEEEIEDLKKTIREVELSRSGNMNGASHGLLNHMVKKLNRLQLRLYTYKFRN